MTLITLSLIFMTLFLLAPGRAAELAPETVKVGRK